MNNSSSHSKNLKILFVGEPLYIDGKPSLGGAQRYTIELVKEMKKTHQCELVTFGEDTSKIEINGLEFKTFPPLFYFRNQKTNPFNLKVFHYLRQFDVIHVFQTHIMISSLIAAWGKILNKKVYTTDFGGGAFDISAYINTNKWYQNHLHISKYSQQLYQKSDSETHSVILGGVDTQRFLPQKGGPHKNGPVLYVGRYLPHKGIDSLIQGLPKNQAAHIVGPPHDLEYYQYLKNLSQDKQVRFLHNLSEQELLREYQQASLICLPSVYKTHKGDETKVPELLGQTLLEGMACGLPALGTDVASIPEIIQHKKNGYLSKPNHPESLTEGIQTILHSEEQYQRYSQEALKTVQTIFSWDSVVQRCLNCYEGKTATSLRAA